MQEFKIQVQQDTHSNNEFLTAPNAIIESYKELPPDTSLAYGPATHLSHDAGSLQSLKARDVFHRYEDQIVPALKKGNRDLDQEIEDYEK